MNRTNKILLVFALLFILWYIAPIYIKPVVIENVLTREECDHIKNIASKRLSTSTVSMSRDIDTKVRQIETAWIKPGEDKVVKKLMDKCLENIDRPLKNCEDLQVLRYKKGGFYNPHQDAFQNDKNRRMYTFIIALNDDYEEGGTNFPNLNKTYKLKKGDSLFFHTLNNYECITKKALHGGLPVKSGEKWICNLWVHKHPYTA